MKKVLVIRKAKIYIHVELDDGSKLVLKEDTVVKHMLYKGMMLDEEKPDYTFEEIERAFYFQQYSDFIDGQNARNEKNRHPERNRTVDDLLKNILQ